jgi:integrase
VSRPSRGATRRRWGTLLPRRNYQGNIVAWQARYTNPINPRLKVQRQFKPEFETQARLWLEEEHYLVIQHQKNIAPWVHPTERRIAEEASRIRFDEFVDNFIKDYRKKDGTRLRGNSIRNLRADISHFMPYFHNKLLNEITEKDIRKWYEGPHPEGPHAFYGACRVLKQIFEQAVKNPDGALIERNPFTLPISSPPESSRHQQAPLTCEEANALARAMPEYTQLSIHLALLVGGLRVGEACAIRLEDIDLEAKLLYVRHSVTRGATDLGPCQLGETKTTSSLRIISIPTVMVTLIRNHMQRFCSVGNGKCMLFTSKRSKSGIISPTTLQQQFRKARHHIGRDDIVFHSLRATHATKLILKGGTLREVMNSLGHNSVTVAVKHYQRVVPDHQKRVANLLAFEYIPSMDDPELLKTVVRETEEEILKMQDFVDGLREQLATIENTHH